jgi:hypothetical protein
MSDNAQIATTLKNYALELEQEASALEPRAAASRGTDPATDPGRAGRV